MNVSIVEGAGKARERFHVTPVNKVEFPKFAAGTSWSDGRDLLRRQ